MDLFGGRAIGLDSPNLAFAPDAAPLSMVWLDPARLSRECLVGAVLAAQPQFTIHGFESLEECLRANEDSPDLVVCYSHAEENVDIKLVEAVHATYPGARVVVLSDAVTLAPAVVRDILSLGVAGFILTRRTGLQMMVSAISLVYSGGTFVPRDFLFMDGQPAVAAAPPKAADGRLTQREHAVLDLIRLGKPNKVVADELGMSASTVKVHVRNIMQKMGVANRTQVALRADEFPRPDQ
ncbi:MAG TPA: response regulator transcription factor [Acidisoma sp.]|uniref:helix-turn-helix transcriptional regulator n=1 Tax=Acidisoma sp. TaxID=1872115 RepID=UPI002C36983E|nr:response regulator transcription factor [Acidisoma sp.]HTH99756.1 response regulator transcription factor [Acidisoma sp.]